jgi:hypothetical protein
VAGIGIAAEAAPVGGDVPGVADRQRQRVRGAPQRVHDLERGRLLPRQAIGVDRVDHDGEPLLSQSPHGGEGRVEVAVHHDETRAGRERLGELAAGDLAGRQDDVAGQARGRGIGGSRGGRVSGRGADDGARTLANGAVHGEHHAAILEGAGGIGALDLQVQLLEADLRAQPPGVDQRGRTLAQRDREGLAFARKQVSVSLEEGPGCHASGAGR